MNKMFNFNGMPRKRSGHAGGKGVSTIGMLVLLMAALLVLPSCFDDDDDETVTENVYVCPDGTTADSKDDCPAVEPPPRMTQCLDGTTVTAPAECPNPPQYDHVIMEDDDKDFNGGDGPDSIAGDMRGNVINGRGGDDEINGMGGKDTLTGGAGDDTLMGGADDDMLHGDEGDDMIYGEAGNDTIVGGPGRDHIDGGGGMDTASYAGSSNGVQVDLSDAEDMSSHGDAFRDTLVNIENLTGSSQADELTGDDNDNMLTGGDGADTLDGKGGNDTLDGGDTTASDDDMLIGGAGDDTLIDDPGNDTFDGGAGNDTLRVTTDTGAVTINLSQATNGDITTNIGLLKVDKDATPVVTTIENVECALSGNTCTLTGDGRVNVLTGGPNGDELNGGGGDDMLDGKGGDDRLNGNAGNDTLTGGPGDNTYNGGEGNDTYMVTVDDTGTIEDAEGMMDVVHYMPKADDEMTKDMDESEKGVGAMGDSVSTPDGIEVVIGTPNADYITANDPGGVTIVGCGGSNVLTGGGDGNDVFGVYNDGANADTIVNFAVGDEIHLKGFTTSDVTVEAIADNEKQAAVKVGGVTVALVGVSETDNNFIPIPAEDGPPVVEAKSRVQRIIEALGKTDTDGNKVVRHVMFDPDKCMN